MVVPIARRLTSEEFRLLLAEELQLDEKQVTMQSSFVEDLAVDSIRMVDLLMRLDALGITFPMESAWETRTVEDAYRCYVEGVEGSGAGEAATRPAAT